MAGTFTAFARRRSEGSEILSPSVRSAIPEGFEAVAEAIAQGTDPAPACEERGKSAVRDGLSLGEVLSGLRETYQLLKAGEPEFVATEALAVAWSESTLEFLHEMSCEDPITGLASQPHLRSRLADSYRAAQRRGEDAGASVALLVVELTEPEGRRLEHFERLLYLSRVGEAVRTVYSGDESIAALGTDRVAALVTRHAALGASVSLLRGLLTELRLPSGSPRVWIEGLPPSPELGARLLDDLAR